MKKIILASLLMTATSAMANTTVLKCVVPESKTVSLNIELADDQSVDFVTVQLNEKNGQTVFFSQMDKGTVDTQIKNGFMNLLALTEKTKQEDGVIRNTGFLGLAKEENNVFSGFLAANGNVYPLTCQ
ncbi:MAG: hypothetical protein ACXVCR_16995 [Bdellovibrio sp.]